MKGRRLALGLWAGSIAVASAGLVGIASGVSGGMLEAARSRYEALRDDEQALLTRLAALRTSIGGVGLPQAAVWPGSDRAAVELAIQNRVLGRAQAAGVVLSAFGPAGPPPDLHMPAVGFQMEATGPWTAVADFLAGIEAERPLLATADLTIRQMVEPEGSAPASMVNLRAVVWGFAPGLAGAEP